MSVSKQAHADAPDRGIRRRTKLATCVAVAAIAPCAPALAAGAQLPSVSAGTEISGALPGACSPANGNEPHAAVDPSDPGHVSVLYSTGGAAAGVVATTRDGGDTWSRTVLPITLCAGGPDGTVGDPFVAIGSAGRVLATDDWNTNDPNHYVNNGSVRLFTDRSDDGGSTFATPVEPEPGAPDQRGPVSFDPGANDRLLVAYERTNYLNGSPGGFLFGLGGSIAVSRSTNGGRSFAPAVQAISEPSGEELLTVALLRSGGTTVLIGAKVYDADLPAYKQGQAPLPEYLIALRSTDDGAHWIGPVQIGTYPLPPSPLVAPPGCCIPDAAVAPDGTLYVAWPDQKAGAITVARSSDQGQSWSTVATLTPGGQVLEPAIAAGPAGTLGLLYYQTSGTPTTSHEYLIPRIATSTDGGQQWSSAALAPAFDAYSIPLQDATPMGPYQDLIALPSGFAATITLPPANPMTGQQEAVWWYRIHP
jgi:hypothetical protein